jgi:hypothetical protein
MKFKFDFITNSSSTCYIAFIPNTFEVTDNMIQEAIDNINNFGEIPDFKKIKDTIDICIEDLKCGELIYNCLSDIDFKIYQILDTLLENAGLYLNSVELGRVNDTDLIIGIKEETINKIFIENIRLNDFIKVNDNDKKNKK